MGIKSVRRLCSKASLFVALFLATGTSAVVRAQLPTATILGVVKDSTGAVVPEASLTAHNTETGQTRSAVTSGDGSYRFSALPVGNYEIRAEHPGFRSAVRSGLTLTVSQEAVVNFTLEVGAIEQTVAVTAEAPLVNTTSGSLGGLVDEQRVADLPLNGRNYIDLTLLQTGIQRHNRVNSGGTTGVWFSSNGAGIRSNNFLLDGAIMQNLFGSGAASVTDATLGVEGIREYRVVTNAFSAEYGLTTGSQMVIVSKGGTNDFHGSLFEYMRNSALDARNFFDRKTDATPRRLPAFTRNNFGGSMGGPIRRDQTFFHTAYEGVRERKGITTVSNVIPSSAKVDGGRVAQINPVIKPLLQLYPDPNLPRTDQFTFPFSQPGRDDYGQVRVDQTFSSNDSLFGRYTIHDAEQIRPRTYPQFEDIRLSRFQYITVSENHIFSPTLLNTFRFSYSRTRLGFDSPSGISGPGLSFVPGMEIGQISIGGVSAFGPDGVPPSADDQDIYTWSNDLFYTRGRHSLKFGTLINRFRQFMFNSVFAKGNVSFANLTAFLLAQPSNFTVLTPGSRKTRTYEYTTIGFYAQDDWRVLDTLTLNLGLRYEFRTDVEETEGFGAALRDVRLDAEATPGLPFINSSLKNFSPRFGFAWDVRGDGKTAVRGGLGLLYDLGSPASALLVGVSATPPFSGLSRVSNPSEFTLPLSFPPEAAGRALRTVDYNLEQSQLLQYNLAVERQLPGQMVLTLAYSGSRGLNLMKSTEGNPTIPQVLPDGRQFWTGREPRVNPNWGDIEWKTGASNSWYNSFQFMLNKRLSHGLQLQSSYTWSKFIDETQAQLNNDNNTSSSFATDPLHREVDRGPGTWDVRQNWRFNTIYRFPELASGGGLTKLLNGWWISGILSLQSGLPFTPTLATNRSRSGVGGGAAGVDRPDLLSGRSNDNIIRGGIDQYFDPKAFTLQQAGFLGTAGRNILSGPGLANLDFSLAKDTAMPFLGESGKLEFRAEFFNILNRANFDSPNRTVFAGRSDGEAPLSTAGRINQTITDSRQIQFALKVLF